MLVFEGILNDDIVFQTFWSRFRTVRDYYLIHVEWSFNFYRCIMKAYYRSVAILKNNSY